MILYQVAKWMEEQERSMKPKLIMPTALHDEWLLIKQELERKTKKKNV